MPIKKGVGLLFLVLLFSGSMFLTFRFEQQSLFNRSDINQDGIVNNLDYFGVLDNPAAGDFAEIYSRAVIDPDGDGNWTEQDKTIIINAWGSREGEKKYDRRADLFPDEMINQIDLHMAQVEEKSQDQWLGNPLKCMNDLVRRAGWAKKVSAERGFEK
ncbi:hypothetical protein AUJ42_00040 [Candidatus Collierbacteria bacterium CG1_02_44_10]|uniref:Dockerin domain-containing protein n=1 Tax=Candidatus Collierbacteria bacterium CG1_02_44_10 TaxID=1805087 RepID=A0A1J4S3I5_9BACT|nr:MAG: hypothetical protein AUJ42_00040 [Candidatus Collierbacteria bacterium CG1_02_44_10]